MLFNQITIIGVGLIGGSFALAARRAGLAKRITGWGGQKSLARALERGVIDAVEEAVAAGGTIEADLIYLSAPVSGIVDFLRQRSRQVRPGTVITDAGSTKRQICTVARSELSETIHFIGGHPLAGSHLTGVEFARADLFEAAPYAVVSSEPGEPASEALGMLLEIVRAIGAVPILTTPFLHDWALARTSHAPQLVSTALALAVSKACDRKSRALSAGGLADMLRLAESRWSIWEDICRTNSDQITSALDEVVDEIRSLKTAIEAGHFPGIGRWFDLANQAATEMREQAEKE